MPKTRLPTWSFAWLPTRLFARRRLLHRAVATSPFTAAPWIIRARHHIVAVAECGNAGRLMIAAHPLLLAATAPLVPHRRYGSSGVIHWPRDELGDPAIGISHRGAATRLLLEIPRR